MGMVGTSHGWIYNNTCINNGGAWYDLLGGSNSNGVRGNFYFAVTGNNTTTSASWTVRNNISIGGYPVEVWDENSSSTYVSFDYNAYQPTDTAKFATLNGGSGFISWSTYSSRESHAVENSNLGLKSNTDYRLRSSSPCKAAGTYITGFHDTYKDFAGKAWKSPNPSIGAYQYFPSGQGGGFGFHNFGFHF